MGKDSYWPLTEVKMESARASKELMVVKMEQDILIKEAEYFAKKSLAGT